MNASLRAKHDELLKTMPEGASHNAEDCAICGDDSLEGDEVTYTDEELQARIDEAVAEATAPLTAKIEELETSEEEAAIKARITEATTDLTTKVEELQAQLDKAVLEAEAAKTELADTVSYLTSVEEEKAAEEEATRIREERLTLVKEVASFPEEHIAANIDRWASMDEEAFQAQVNDWKLITPKPVDLKVPAETAMQGTAPPKQHADEGRQLMSEIFDMTVRGDDPRRV